jgi:hypothetical protein
MFKLLQKLLDAIKESATRLHQRLWLNTNVPGSFEHISISVVHDSVRRGVEPDLYSVSTARVETLYTDLVPWLIESRIFGSGPGRARANSSYR